jgi:hypothetical protein
MARHSNSVFELVIWMNGWTKSTANDQDHVVGLDHVADLNHVVGLINPYLMF